MTVYEETGHTSQGRPDVIVKDASGWPVVIEAERTDHRSAEADALKNFDRDLDGRPVETAIALVYPPEVRDEHHLQTIRGALDVTKGVEYCLFTRSGDGAPPRTPERGWKPAKRADSSFTIRYCAGITTSTSRTLTANGAPAPKFRRAPNPPSSST